MSEAWPAFRSTVLWHWQALWHLNGGLRRAAALQGENEKKPPVVGMTGGFSTFRHNVPKDDFFSNQCFLTLHRAAR